MATKDAYSIRMQTHGTLMLIIGLLELQFCRFHANSLLLDLVLWCIHKTPIAYINAKFGDLHWLLHFGASILICVQYSRDGCNLGKYSLCNWKLVTLFMY